MQIFTVLYRDTDAYPAEPPLAFCCSADDGDHAEEQCENAYPDCEVLWVVQTDDPQAAFDDYYELIEE
jgi:hypothetical protein